MIRLNLDFNPIVIVIIVIAALAVIAGMILLQIFLSKRESKWLILPIISFLLSLIYPLNIVNTGDTWRTSGSLYPYCCSPISSPFAMLVIYAAIRKNRKKKAQLEKMNIQDLN